MVSDKEFYPDAKHTICHLQTIDVDAVGHSVHDFVIRLRPQADQCGFAIFLCPVNLIAHTYKNIPNISNYSPCISEI